MTDGLPLPADVLDEVARYTGRHDRDGEFAPGYVGFLRASGLLAHRDLTDPGHRMAHLRQVSALARHCASTAFIVHMHHVARTLLSAVAEHDAPVLDLLGQADSPLFCSLNSEPGMHYRRGGTRSSTVTWHDTEAGRHAKVVAEKHFCSGARYADFAFSLVGGPPLTRPWAAIIPLKHAGVAVGAPVELLGLRATDSRHVRFDVDLPATNVLPVSRPLPTALWSLGYAAMSHGVGSQVVAALTARRPALRDSGRWGEYEQLRLGQMVSAQESCTYALRAAGSAALDDARHVLVAKLRAAEFATESARTAMEIVGGESVVLGSPWSRLFRDAVTLSLLPPSRDRAWRVLGAEEPIAMVPTAPEVPTGAAP